jgi:hypothetical protein
LIEEINNNAMRGKRDGRPSVAHVIVDGVMLNGRPPLYLLQETRCQYCGHNSVEARSVKVDLSCHIKSGYYSPRMTFTRPVEDTKRNEE